MIMPQTNKSDLEYRGYTLVAVEHAPGWRVHIYPGHGLLHTHPDSVSAITREEALTKARSVIDSHLLH